MLSQVLQGAGVLEACRNNLLVSTDSSTLHLLDGGGGSHDEARTDAPREATKTDSSWRFPTHPITAATLFHTADGGEADSAGPSTLAVVAAVDAAGRLHILTAVGGDSNGGGGGGGGGGKPAPSITGVSGAIGNDTASPVRLSQSSRGRESPRSWEGGSQQGRHGGGKLSRLQWKEVRLEVWRSGRATEEHACCVSV
jgi:hypothetical protein